MPRSCLRHSPLSATSGIVTRDEGLQGIDFLFDTEDDSTYEAPIGALEVLAVGIEYPMNLVELRLN
jgi:hypothetical protein